MVTQFFPTSPNQNYYVTKLEALYVVNFLEELDGRSKAKNAKKCVCVCRVSFKIKEENI